MANLVQQPYSRKQWRAIAGALVAIALSLIPVPGAKAQGEEILIATQSNWFWSSNSKVTVCQNSPRPDLNQTGVCGPVSGTQGAFGNASGTTSPISQGHIAVAIKDGSSDMRAYVAFPDLPFGAVVESYVVQLRASMPEPGHIGTHQQRGLKPPATINENTVEIQACAVPFAEAWGGAQAGDGGDPPYATTVQDPAGTEAGNPTGSVSTTRAEPGVDTGQCLPGKFNADTGYWEFDITKIARKWSSGESFNNGLAILPIDRGASANWTLEFHGAPYSKVNPEDPDGPKIIVVSQQEAARAKVFYTGGEGPPPPPPPPPPEPPLPPLPPIPPTIIPPDTPSFGPTPSPEPPPSPPTQPVASNPKTPGYVWAVLPFGALMLGLTASAVGADGSPASATNRVASVLRARRIDPVGPSDEPVSEESS